MGVRQSQPEPQGSEPRDFRELRDTGLLWLINTTVFHPRGYALALHYSGDPQDGSVTGWSLQGDGSEPFVFTDDFHEQFRAVSELLGYNPVSEDS